MILYFSYYTFLFFTFYIYNTILRKVHLSLNFFYNLF